MRPNEFIEKLKHGDFIRNTIKSESGFYTKKPALNQPIELNTNLITKEFRSESERFGLKVASTTFNTNFSGCYKACTLYDHKEEVVLWQRDVYHIDNAHVEDDGWVWTLSGENYISGYDPSGHECGRVHLKLKEVLSPKHTSTENWSHGTSFHWGREYSCSFFIQRKQKLYFCVAPWWHEYVLVDLYSGKHVPVTEELRKDINEELSRFASKQLRKGVYKRVIEGSEQCLIGNRGIADIRAAVLIAGRLKLKGLSPFLKELENAYFIDTKKFELQQTDWRILVPGEVNPFDTEVHPFCQLSQLALRRSNVTPCNNWAYRFVWHSNEVDAILNYEPPPLPEPREKRLHLVKTGMNAKDVIAAIGTPDFIYRKPPNYWDYDIMENPDEPYTLRLYWSDIPRKEAGRFSVAEIETIKPPPWLNSYYREQAIITGDYNQEPTAGIDIGVVDEKTGELVF